MNRECSQRAEEQPSRHLAQRTRSACSRAAPEISAGLTKVPGPPSTLGPERGVRRGWRTWHPDASSSVGGFSGSGLGEGQPWLSGEKPWALLPSDMRRGGLGQSWIKPRPWLLCCVHPLSCAASERLIPGFWAPGRKKMWGAPPPLKGGWGSTGVVLGSAEAWRPSSPAPMVPREPVWKWGRPQASE